MITTLVNFLAMGGYAAFIWPAYAVAASIMIVLWWTSMSSYRRNRRALEALQMPRSRRGSAV
jgi:heme exporter protein D